jgi:putative Mg2+ transporter-C (MgtC) family protein
MAQVSFLGPGQGWPQLGELGMAFVLSALIGLEREIRHKSAGFRTYTLVGLASALIMLISKYGFANILEAQRVVLDPSRIAAQIVTGIGFIGGGLIFVRRDAVKGLTTAAIVWLTAAVGMACGAGLPVLALAATLGHFIVVFTFPMLVQLLPKTRWTPSILQIAYQDGREILREVLIVCTQHDFAVSRLQVQRPAPSADVSAETPDGEPKGEPAATTSGKVSVKLQLQGKGSVAKLAGKLSEIDGVVSVTAGDVNVLPD